MKSKKPFYLKKWFWITVIVLVIIGNFMNEEEPAETASTKNTEEKIKTEETKVDHEGKLETDLKDGLVGNVDYLNFSLGGNTSGRIDIELIQTEGMTPAEVHEDIYNLVKILHDSKVKYYDALIQVFHQDELVISLIYNKATIKDVDMATFAVNNIYQTAVNGEKYRFVHPDYVISF